MNGKTLGHSHTQNHEDNRQFESNAERTYVDDYFSSNIGGAAIEFALLSPLLILLIFGIVVYATVFGVYHGVQELSSEAARASVGGLTDQERAQLATSYVQTNAASYAFIDPTRITVAGQSTGNPATAYQVTVSYDMSASFVYQFAGILPLPGANVQRTAVVVFGGY